jgi:hypothetical protein
LKRNGSKLTVGFLEGGFSSVIELGQAQGAFCREMGGVKYVLHAEEYFGMQFGKSYILLRISGEYPGLMKGYSKIPCPIAN